MRTSVALTPPMGWNSWDCYGAAVTEKQLLENARYVSENLLEFGWEYVVCDIQWYEPLADSNFYHPFAELCMDSLSRLIPAENRFPSATNGAGFRPIADKIHAMGLKFGIHIMRGIPRQAVHANTPIDCPGVTARDIAASFSLCSWNTDMYGVDAARRGAAEYYNSLFRLYARWGVDFVKCDDISNTEFRPGDPYSAKAEIELIRQAIDNCGRDMVLSLSPGPAPSSQAEHLRNNANMWRMTGDFWDSWDKLHAMFSYCREWQGKGGECAWPDCDMLPLGRISVNCECGGERGRLTMFTYDEQITMLSLWCIFRSPLMLGGVLPETDNRTLSLLTNRDILKMHRTSRNARELFCREGTSGTVGTDGGTDGDTGGDIIWTADGEQSESYYAIFNTRETAAEISITPADGFTRATELWSSQDLYPTDGKFILSVPAHGAKVLRFCGC